MVVESRSILRRSLVNRTSCLTGAPVDNVINRTGITVELGTGNFLKIAGVSDANRHVDQHQFEGPIPPRR